MVATLGEVVEAVVEVVGEVGRLLVVVGVGAEVVVVVRGLVVVVVVLVVVVLVTSSSEEVCTR